MSKPRCAALDDKGKHCRRQGIRRVQYHGENELYGYFNEPWPSWVSVMFCGKHSEAPTPRAPRRKK